MAATGEDELKQCLQEAFQKVDTDRDGVISDKELKVALQKAGLSPSKEDVKTLMTFMDLDKSGKISFEEFAYGVICIGVTCRVVMSLRHAFEELDTDGSGYITKDDLVKLPKSRRQTDDHVTNECIEEVLASCDIDGDGKVSFEEFACVLLKALESSKKK